MINLYYHSGSENHGCEAIVRSTNKILEQDLILHSSNIKSDKKYGIDKIVTLKENVTESIKANSIESLSAKLYAKTFKSDLLFTKYRYSAFFNNIKKSDIYMSIGGDNYCYAGRDILGHCNKLIHKKGAKTVLWGCSFEPSDINELTIPDIKMYDMIIARESESYNALKAINENTFLFPDPAFQLDLSEVPLPAGFSKGNTVGINVSPLIMDCEKNEGAAIKNYEKLIEHIINNTDMQIALIPHVVIKNSDDRKAMQILFNKFKSTGRIIMVDDFNCMQLKYIISKLRFLVTARTHASVAAYSTKIPTLVVGYSIKAKGIAKDIFGTYKNYVIPVQELKQQDDLKNAFIWLQKEENAIKNHFENFMPSYINRALKAKEKIMELL